MFNRSIPKNKTLSPLNCGFVLNSFLTGENEFIREETNTSNRNSVVYWENGQKHCNSSLSLLILPKWQLYITLARADCFPSRCTDSFWHQQLWLNFKHPRESIWAWAPERGQLLFNQLLSITKWHLSSAWSFFTFQIIWGKKTNKKPS